MLGAIDDRLSVQAPIVMVSHSMQGGCLCENAPGLHTLGYRELLAHLGGTMSLDEAVDTIALRTRQLAKRQETWFRRVAGVVWFDLESPDQFPEVARVIVEQTGEHPDSP